MYERISADNPFCKVVAPPLGLPRPLFISVAFRPALSPSFSLIFLSASLS